MKEILKYAAASRMVNVRNYILKKSLENKIVEDKVIKVAAIEVTEFMTKLNSSISKNNEK